MFFSVARLRQTLIFAAILFPSFAYSREETLFTSSVTYCAPPESLLVEQFDFAYIAKNNSIFFNISAASVDPNVSVRANLFLNVYGMKPINKSIDLCNIFDGALCPLPMYNFTGSDSLTLPASLGVSDHIPNIAFKIPDLEAYAQLSLIEVGTGSIKACVQATLSNGWSAHQTGVEWSTGAMALLALLLAIPQSFVPSSFIPFRFFDLLFLYQSIAASAFLNLNYPSVYRSFALNFAWSMGLVFTSATSSVQNSINAMRHRTGGAMPDASGSAIGLVNRKLSPYNDALVNPLRSLVALLSNGTAGVTLEDGSPPVREVVTVTPSSPNVLEAGIPIYVNSVNVGTANAFMTVFICALIIVAVALALIGLGYAAIRAVCRRRGDTKERYIELKRAYTHLVRAWALRLCLAMFFPVIIFAMFQWTLKDSRLSLALSVITFVSILGGIMYPTIRTHLHAFHTKPYNLYTTPRYLTLFGPLYGPYRPSRYYFFTPLLCSTFFKAALIAFLHNRGEAQVIAIAITEALLLVAHATLRPHTTRGGDVLGTSLTVARLIGAGLSIAFVQRLRLAAIPRVVIGIVIAIVFSVAVVGVWVNVLVHAWRVVRGARGRAGAGAGGDRASMSEKRGALMGSMDGSRRDGSVDLVYEDGHAVRDLDTRTRTCSGEGQGHV